MTSTDIGQKIYDDIKLLYPMNRSLTGNDIKATLEYIRTKIPITIYEIKSGTKVFDWTVPKEWNLKNAYIENFDGERIIDVKNHYLHLLNYSVPINDYFTFDELKIHLHTMPEHPEWIPYKTSYYNENWGFCLSHNDYLKMEEYNIKQQNNKQQDNNKQQNNNKFKVVIDTTLEDGNLYYGDLLIKGKTDKEILISSYCCHPQQCNDSLSGTILAMYLALHLLKTDNYYTYRFVFIPETIGSIVYLHKYMNELKEYVIGGYVITCVGDEGNFTYLQTRLENQFIDNITLCVLENEKIYNNMQYKVREYITSGSDERQYNYPCVDLHIGSLMKTKYREFDEYHTSADNLSFITNKGLHSSYYMYLKCIELIEKNKIYLNNTICEPFMSKYNLYDTIGGSKTVNLCHEMLSVMRFVDNKSDLIHIWKKTKMSLEKLYKIINILTENKLIDIKIID